MVLYRRCLPTSSPTSRDVIIAGVSEADAWRYATLAVCAASGALIAASQYSNAALAVASAIKTLSARLAAVDADAELKGSLAVDCASLYSRLSRAYLHVRGGFWCTAGVRTPSHRVSLGGCAALGITHTRACTCTCMYICTGMPSSCA